MPHGSKIRCGFGGFWGHVDTLSSMSRTPLALHEQFFWCPVTCRGSTLSSTYFLYLEVHTPKPSVTNSAVCKWKGNIPTNILGRTVPTNFWALHSSEGAYSMLLWERKASGGTTAWDMGGCSHIWDLHPPCNPQYSKIYHQHSRHHWITGPHPKGHVTVSWLVKSKSVTQPGPRWIIILQVHSMDAKSDL